MGKIKKKRKTEKNIEKHRRRFGKHIVWKERQSAGLRTYTSKMPT